MSKITDLYKTKIEPVLSNKKKEQEVYTELSKIIANAYTANMASDESFCFKFSIPELAVNNLYKILGLNPLEVSYAFTGDWGQTLTAMHKDPYYQILLLLLYHGIKTNNKNLANNALMIILIKIWNGRKAKFFKYCDKRIMKYVVSNMLTNRHKISKFENPVSLLKDYYTPTILEKYGPEVKSDPIKLKRLFEQCHARVYQLFLFNNRTNLRTGESEAQGGLLPLYMKARQEGLYISVPGAKAGEDEEVPGFDQYTTTHNRDEIVSKTTDFIVMNTKATYPINLVSDINRKTNVSTKIIEKILAALHDHRHIEIIQNLIVLFLSRTNINAISDICSGNFSQSLQKNVISSKNNEEVNKIQKLLDILLEKIFKEKLELNFNNYSLVHKIKIRNVIIFGLEYNLFRVNCRGN